MFARIVALFVTSYLLLVTLVSPTFAQTTPIPSNVSPTSPIFTDLILSNTFHTFSCLGIGSSVIGQPCLSYQFSQNSQGLIQAIPVLSQTNLSGGALGMAGSLIGSLYNNRPVKTTVYLASVGENLGIIKQAHAQVVGSGAAVLDPILNLWQVSRNIAYVVMIIIFVVIGLMVMFRQRLNPQTVITAQSSLPGLVLGLILITFSYFLAGLVSDAAFVGTNLVGYYFSAVNGDYNNNTNLLKSLSNENILSIFSRYAGIMDKDNAATALSSIWSYLDNGDLVSNPQRVLTMLAGLLAAQFILPFAGLAGGIGQLIGGTLVGGYTLYNPTAMVGLALSFTAMAILIYTMFRLLLKLLNSYLMIIFLVVTAPFHFLASALPGRQGIATNWVLNLLSSVLAFPAVLVMFYFAAYLLGRNFGPVQLPPPKTTFNQSFPASVSAQDISTSPIKLGASAAFPLFGGINLDFVRVLLAFAALLATPTIPDVISKTVGRPSQAGQMLGQGVGAMIGGGRGYSDQFNKGMGGFAERFGNLRDQPGRVAEITRENPKDPNSRIISSRWRETRASEAGMPGPTQGGISRVIYSQPWQKTIGRLFNRKPKPPEGTPPEDVV